MLATTITDTVETLKGALLDMASAFDLSESTLPGHESRECLEVFKSYTGEGFRHAFPQDRIHRWFSHLGADLHLRIDTIDDDDSIEVGVNVGRSKLGTLYQKIMKNRIDRIEVRAVIAKRHMIAVLSREVGAQFNALYFFHDTLASRLTLTRIQPLFDSDVLPPNEHAIIGILCSPGLIWSRYLTIVGFQDFDSAEFLRSPASTRYQTKWNHARLMRDAITTWQDSLSAVDPHYLQVKSEKPGLEIIADRLLGLSEVLAIFQFCISVVSHEDGAITAQVTRPGGAVLKVAPGAVYSPLRTTVSATLGTPAFQLFRWAFQGEDYDKIDLVRDLIDREVRGRDGDLMRHLLQSSPDLLTSARAGFKVLRQQALDRYWKVRQEAKDKVDSYVATIRTRIDTIRKDMLTRAIQFFAAIAGFFGLSVLQPDLPSWIRALGVGFSIIYIVLIGLFQLLPALLDYRNLRGAGEDAVKGYDVLSPNERNAITSMLPSGWRNEFVVWLAACGVVYFVELIAFLVLLIALGRGR